MPYFHFWDEFVYAFPPFNLIPRVLKKLVRRSDGEGVGCDAGLENANIDLAFPETHGKKTHLSAVIEVSPDPPIGLASRSSSVSKAQTDGLYLIRKTIKNQGLKKSEFIMMSSWRSKTRTQYNIYFQRYAAFCDKNLDPLNQSKKTVVRFLTDMFHEGYGYSSLNTARSAILCLSGVGSFPMVCRFMRGVFKLRPTRPRYSYILGCFYMYCLELFANSFPCSNS